MSDLPRPVAGWAEEMRAGFTTPFPEEAIRYQAALAAETARVAAATASATGAKRPRWLRQGRSEFVFRRSVKRLVAQLATAFVALVLAAGGAAAAAGVDVPGLLSRPFTSQRPDDGRTGDQLVTTTLEAGDTGDEGDIAGPEDEGDEAEDQDDQVGDEADEAADQGEDETGEADEAEGEAGSVDDDDEGVVDDGDEDAADEAEDQADAAEDAADDALDAAEEAADLAEDAADEAADQAEDAAGDAEDAFDEP